MRRRSIDLTTTHLAATCKKKKKRRTHTLVYFYLQPNDGWLQTHGGGNPALADTPE